MICERCKECWNYMVSEVGCYGSTKICEHFYSDDQESFLAFFQERADHEKAMRQKVSSVEYIDWLYNYVSSHGFADDEGALYTYRGVDSENGQILSWFVSYLQELASNHGVRVEDDPFVEKQIVVKIRDKFFSACTIYGQGSWSAVKLLDEEPNGGYVVLPDRQEVNI